MPECHIDDWDPTGEQGRSFSLRESFGMLHQRLNVGQFQIRPIDLNTSRSVKSVETSIRKIICFRFSVGVTWSPIQVASQSNLLTGAQILHEDNHQIQLRAKSLAGVCAIHPSRERLRFMEEDLCMGIALMALTFLVICHGQCARQLDRSASWNLKQNVMSILNMQATCIHLVSGTSMMDSVCELRSVSVSLPLRLFNCRRRRSPLIWCCHVQLL